MPTAISGSRSGPTRNQDLGPLINHEMNRCITCYRCVRYYRDYAGGDDLQSFASKNHVYFGRQQPGTLESEFSGNLVEVCPTGVFTDKTLKKHYTRRWDLATAPSVCGHCAVGCNTFPGERYGMLRRVRNRYNGELNGYFLCDRGRYGYEYVNAAERIRNPAARRSRRPFRPRAARRNPGRGRRLAARSCRGGGDRLGPRLARGQFRAAPAGGRRRTSRPACRRATSDLLGGPAGLPAAGQRAGRRRSRQIEEAEAVVILGEDVLQTAARIALAVRQASRNLPMAMSRKAGIPDWNDLAVREIVQDQKGIVILATPAADQARRPGYRAPLPGAGRPRPLRLRAGGRARSGRRPGRRSLAGAGCRRSSGRPPRCAGVGKIAVISGMSLGSEAVLRAAAAVAGAAKSARQGGQPGAPAARGQQHGAALSSAASRSRRRSTASKSGGAETLLIGQNDLYRRMDAALVDRLLGAAKHVVVLDHSPTATTRRADVLLPAATLGRRRRHPDQLRRPGPALLPGLRARRPAHPEIAEAWRWTRDLAGELGLGEAWRPGPSSTTCSTRSRPDCRRSPASTTRRRTPASASAASRSRASRTARAAAPRSGRTSTSARSGCPSDPDSALLVLDGRLPGRGAAGGHLLLLGAGLELGFEHHPLPGRDRRPLARR